MVGIKWKSFSDSVSTLVPGDQTVLSPRPAEFSPGPAAVETTEKCSLPSLQPLLHLNEIHSIYVERMRTVGDCV